MLADIPYQITNKPTSDLQSTLFFLKILFLILWRRMQGTKKRQGHGDVNLVSVSFDYLLSWATDGDWWVLAVLLWVSAEAGVAQFQFKVITKYISIFSLFNISPRWEIPRRAQSVPLRQQKQGHIYLPLLKRRIIFCCFLRASFRNNLAASKWLPFKASHWGLVPAFARKPFLFLFRVRVCASSLASCRNLPSMLSACLQYFVEISQFSCLPSICFSSSSMAPSLRTHPSMFSPTDHLSSTAESHLYTLVKRCTLNKGGKAYMLMLDTQSA